MPSNYETNLYQRIHGELDKVAFIDCHEHLQRERELPTGEDIHIGRFFAHYADCDLVSAGMPDADRIRVQSDATLTPRDRWKLLEPWYTKAWNTAYCEALRLAIRDLYGIEEFSEDTVDELTRAMCEVIQPGFMIGERVLRPAMVGVSKGGPKTAPAESHGSNGEAPTG